MGRVRADLASAAGSTVVMAHAFVTGGGRLASPSATSASAAWPPCRPSVFDGVDYAALGHLHGRQAGQRSGPLQRVSPSPCRSARPISVKAAWLVDLARGGAPARAVEAPVARPLRRAARRPRGAARRPAPSRYAEAAWCQVTLTDPLRPLGAMDRVRRRFPHALELRFEPRDRPCSSAAYSAARCRHATDARRVLRLPGPRARRDAATSDRSGPCWPRPSRPRVPGGR